MFQRLFEDLFERPLLSPAVLLTDKEGREGGREREREKRGSEEVGFADGKVPYMLQVRGNVDTECLLSCWITPTLE